MGQIWDALLSGLGTMLSFFYDVIPSYAFAIVLLTVAVRIILLPLGIKQTRSMQAMQKIQPQVKELQRKYKGNRQKMTEELQKLYKEHQVNPLAGCLPLLLQLPVFFALYQVLVKVEYLPEGGALRSAILAGQGRDLGMNLACSPSAVFGGGSAPIQGGPEVSCGGGFPIVLVPILLMALMAFTTWYQQRQMTRASQATGQSQQMQLMGRIMPILLTVISWSLPTGVLVYWVTTNGWQIGQQTFMLRSRDGAQPAAAGDGKVIKAQATPVQKKPQGKKAQSPPAKKPSGSKGGKGGQRGRKKRSKR